MSDETSITLSQAIEQVMAQTDGPLGAGELTRRVLAIYPSKAKRPGASVRNRLRWEDGKTIVFLDRQTVIPLRLALRGVRFRIPVARREASRGILFTEPAFNFFLRRDIAQGDVRLMDAAGGALPAAIQSIDPTPGGPTGAFVRPAPAFDLGDWFRANRIQRNDSILVTIEDWETGCFRLEHEPAGCRRQAEIERKNQELADLLFDMLESTRVEYLYVSVAIPTAYARLADARGYPGDHWVDVVKRDSRLSLEEFAIRYRDFYAPLDRMLSDPADVRFPEEPYTRAQGRQVYRFQVVLAYRPDLWRCIEIQGRQTLVDLDEILRKAFEHDPLDHLGGFWKWIRRGSSRRFREIDLGSIDPFGGGEGADLHVAGLGLNPGDQLKYVYDFGDWIEHFMTLEGIAEPEPGAEYPRIAAQNEPHYRDCGSCKARGRKTRAL